MAIATCFSRGFQGNAPGHIFTLTIGLLERVHNGRNARGHRTDTTFFEYFRSVFILSIRNESQRVFSLLTPTSPKLFAIDRVHTPPDTFVMQH